MTALLSSVSAFGDVLCDYLALKHQQTGPSLRAIGQVIVGWHSAKVEAEARSARFGNLFNPLSLIPLKETIHSRIIGELLNPRGSHGQDDLFLRCLLKRLRIPEPESGKWKLTVEADRVDLMLVRAKPRSVILIENKVNDAVDQPNQLYRYWHRQVFRRYPSLNYEEPETHQSFRVIYLSNDGRKAPEPHSIARPDDWKGINPMHPTLPLAWEPLGLGDLLNLLKATAFEEAPETNVRLRTFVEMYSEIWNL